MAKRTGSLKLTRLTYYLIVKSITDVLLIAILGLGFYLTAFNPYFHGWVDDANSRWVRGWVINRAAPAVDVEAQLYIDGRFVESQPANQPRPDIVATQLAENEKHGFFFTTPALEAGEHEARVFAVHESGEGERRTLQLVGKPFHFVTEGNPAEPYFRGWVDEANAQYVRGWIIDSATPAANPEVQLYIDKRFIESRAANQPRPDLVAARVAGDEKHGFFFTTPALEEGEHEARVYVVHESGSEKNRILRLIEKPTRFIVKAAESKPSAEEESKTSENSSR
ncbi:MAG: hypothetical protein H0U54_19380 [Acidobacteria bacterium]|nr:hypothetical protein [Acidobacteriota bacterium]